MIPPQFSLTLLFPNQGSIFTYHFEGTWLNEDYDEAQVCLDTRYLRAMEISLFKPNDFKEILDDFHITGFGDSDSYDSTIEHNDKLKCLSWTLEVS